MDSQRVWLWVIAIIIIVLAAYVWWYNTSAPAPSSVPGNATSTEFFPEQTGTSSSSSASSTDFLQKTVTYGDNGFTPSQVTVAVGGTVTFVNQSTGSMWVASNPHPTHDGYSGTTLAQHCPDSEDVAFDECAAGTTYTFTFEKAGTWRYHNHLDATMTGTIVVTP